VTGAKLPADDVDRAHYSYSRYADPSLAESFDATRFGGPIGQHLLETQERILLEALPDVQGRPPEVLDVGTGTGRAAIGLALAGAKVIGVDASAEMLAVARRRAADAGVAIQFEIGDAHALPAEARSVDLAVCLRVLMHVPDWRRCVAELCRVSRARVVVDFPARMSVAAIESLTRRTAARAGWTTEPYRCLAERAVEQAFEANGFHVTAIHRQFALPIALYKTIGSLPFALGLERTLRLLGLVRLLGSPVTMVAER
jgi:ubiquinone/menaquinone biosynthesis C-methylase UbiE